MAEQTPPVADQVVGLLRRMIAVKQRERVVAVFDSPHWHLLSAKIDVLTQVLSFAERGVWPADVPPEIAELPAPNSAKQWRVYAGEQVKAVVETWTPADTNGLVMLELRSPGFDQATADELAAAICAAAADLRAGS